jgi:hypothetical protein
MGKVHLTRELAHPADKAWVWIKDFKNIHHIHPALGNSYLTGEKSCGVGATRVCEMKMGGFNLKERVTDWNEGRYYTVDIFETTMPMIKRSVATLGVRPLSATTSEVYMDIDYKTKYGLFGKAMEHFGMNLMFKLILGAMFRKLDKNLSQNASPGNAAAQRA